VPLKITYGGTVLIEEVGQPAPEPSRAGVWMTAKSGGFTVRAKGPRIMYTLGNDKSATVKVSYQDAKGNEAAVDGDVAWSSSDTSIVDVEVDSNDSTLAVIMPSDNLGQAQIIATADADLGDGVVEIVCTLDVNVVAGQAVVGVISPVGPAHPIA
jgi:hypothetical protein